MKYLCLILLATSVTGRFTDDFYQQLAKDNANKNLISSPLSAEIVMSMVYMASGGKTAQEMRDVLKLPADKKEVARKYKDFLTNLEGREKVAILELANRIYVNDRYSLLPEFNKVVKDSFKAEAEAISVKDPQKAVSIINKWVKEQTRNRIKSIAEEKDINPDLTVVLLNAIYFKGQWQEQFNSSNTKKADFRTADKKIVPVQMMSHFGKFRANYIPKLDAKVIELPYRNSSLSMVIFLPEKVDGLPELEKKIADFPAYIPVIQEVDLKLPKFKIEFKALLNDILEKMGIVAAFTDKADFSGLVQIPTKISKVIQKAFIEVNEEGAEAAAVTGVIGSITLIARPRPLVFNADHPFAYIIRDEKTIYFQGHFVKP
ncbi:serine protease inhibitor 42Dd-like [Drosophila takahashii]|uniref:serine protease inhibitor 42Dd-like n=1 Tax=Drosophila takahashii TaxID=29030 RepID=UPI001CF9006C|nr:serine protease inhibitor 42Dd-like [Drosophila takahashii]